MKTNVYIDGFNFYYGCLKGTPHKWLDLAAFCQASFPPPRNQISRVRYFTAHLTARPNDPLQLRRQQIYLRALRTIPQTGDGVTRRGENISVAAGARAVFHTAANVLAVVVINLELRIGKLVDETDSWDTCLGITRLRSS